jgi:hypothetical protein
MGLVQWKYESRRRKGTGTKALEQRGDWPRLMEHLTKLSEAHGAHETAEELRKQLKEQLNPSPKKEPESEPETPRIRRSKPKSPPPSPDQKLREAWREVDAKRGRT